MKIYLSQQIQENAVHLWIATKNSENTKYSRADLTTMQALRKKKAKKDFTSF